MKFTVAFDLDGTLIDSAPAILESLSAALEDVGATASRPLAQELIGPPLGLMLSDILGLDQAHLLPIVIERFKRHYDDQGYRSTSVFPGADHLLRQLNNAGVRLLIATNKRMVPTRLILRHFRWDSLFDGIRALDYYVPALPEKTALLEKLSEEFGLDAFNAVFVGDRREDSDAAVAIGLPFIHAAWGYASSTSISTVSAVATQPADVLPLVEGMCRNSIPSL